MASNRSSVIGIERHRSFPNPPSQAELSARLDCQITTTAESPSVLFTDDPSVIDAPVVVTTQPRVVRELADTTTPIQWSHDEPPWAFLSAALDDAASRQSAADGGAVRWGTGWTRPTGHDRAGRPAVDTEMEDTAAAEYSKTLLRSIGVPAAAITVSSDDARITDVNDAFVSLTDGPVVGASLVELEGRVPDPVADRLWTTAEQAQTDDPGVGQEMISLDQPDGTRHYVTHDASIQTTAGVRSVVVFTDVTGLKRRETQTAVLTRILRHDLRNEVTVLRGWAERIERLTDDDRVGAAADRIISAATTLNSLGKTAGSVQTVLTDRETPWTVHDPQTLIAEAVSRVDERYPEAVVDVGRIEPDRVVGTHHLEHAVAELVENAVAHAGSADAHASVRVRETDEDLQIVVADKGPGIPDTDWAVVADQQEITQLNHASGLGLWLVRWIVENNGGWLERTERESGTTVLVHLPQH